MNATELAKIFHDTYEQLAPSFGYQTRRDTAFPWEHLPENNKKLMIATCEKIIEKFENEPGRLVAERECENCKGKGQLECDDQSEWCNDTQYCRCSVCHGIGTIKRRMTRKEVEEWAESIAKSAGEFGLRAWACCLPTGERVSVEGK